MEDAEAIIAKAYQESTAKYEWFDPVVSRWVPIDRLPFTWEKELGLEWRERK